jgi:hypothetical protein
VPVDDDLGALELVILDHTFGDTDKVQGAPCDLQVVARVHRLDPLAALGGRNSSAGDQHADPEMGDRIAPSAAR